MDLEARKKINLSNQENFSSFSVLTWREGVKCAVSYDESGEISSCLCSKCLTKIDRSPIYNSKYVYPMCVHCLADVAHIENPPKKEVNMKTKKVRTDKLVIDWVAFEKAMSEGSAKLVKLAEEHNSYPVDFKAALVAKYGGRLAFKKGRNGGIVWCATKMVPNV